ncbi:succinoglycan biosynthesis protein exoi [Ensifer sp.]|jgi:hypothetical protein|uniref:sunset domain-containing protein n=1 Tax=Ensifer sp. TaxID=1872086 RepID=UPI002E0F7C09|nr:succinoglycan biosynthesis protein exoi [Ensifer sp.]
MRNYHQFRKAKPKQSFFAKAPALTFGLVTVAIAGIFSAGSFTSLATGLGLSPSCNIKGNVSINSRERIYHVPGQERYAETNISPQYGERWFCSESEARAAGWRKAGR